jgi:hypothetical protein
LDQALYKEIYCDIAKQLFPHGLPPWITDAGRGRAHSQIAEIALRSMRDMGRFDGDPLVEARRTPLTDR